MSTQALASKNAELIDSVMLNFVLDKVNSFVKWDLVHFFHNNEGTAETAENIARFTGRDPVAIQPELQALADSGVLQCIKSPSLTVYTLSNDPTMEALVNAFIVACENRQFRSRAVQYLLREMI